MRIMFKTPFAPDSGESSPGTSHPATPERSIMNRAFEAKGGVVDDHHTNNDDEDGQDPGFLGKLRGLIKKDRQPTLRNTIADYIEDKESADAPVTAHAHTLISNVVTLHDMTVTDVMIPRADIVAITIGTSQKELLALLAEKQFSRLPVYRETLDDVIGTIHIKDILACLARNEPIVIENLIRDAPIVSPAMPVLDLILMMKQRRKHLAFVVDEFGGIDGLVTIGDVIESIIGEVEDEHGPEDESQRLHTNPDGTVTADARVDIETFERHYGRLLTDKEREDIDTLGGLIFAMGGRIPARGELLTHSSGMVFEVIDADPRRVNKVVIRNLPATHKADE